MSKAMQLRRINNRKAAKERRARLAADRLARARLEFEIHRLKMVGLAPPDFTVEGQDP